MNPSDVVAVILAAGKGTRMKSGKAKVLHEVFFKPMLHWVLDAVSAAGVSKHALIIGHQRERVMDSLSQYSFTPVIQEEQLGTGHAVLCAEKECSNSETVMILCGDTPLIRSDTLGAMLEQHQRESSVLTLMTTVLDDPFGYGRIISDDNGNILQIVEQKDADHEQRKIQEINAGIYLVDREFLFTALKKVGTDNSQGEVYLTDIVAIANKQGIKPRTFTHPVAIDVLGVNSRVELDQAHGELSKRRNQELLLSGVTMYGSQTITIAPGIPVGKDTIIHPGVQVTGNSSIGNDCVLEAGCQALDSDIGDKAHIGSNAVVHNCTIENNEHIPPLTYRAG